MTQQLTFDGIPPDYRKHYAEQFNTTIEYVRYWDELDQKQKDYANRAFCYLNMNQYVYCLSFNGHVITRRMLEYGDI